MLRPVVSSDPHARSAGRRRSGAWPQLLAAILGLAVLAGLPARVEGPGVLPGKQVTSPVRMASASHTADLRMLLDPKSALPADALKLGANAPLPMILQPVSSWGVASAAPAMPAPVRLAAAPQRPAPRAAPVRVAQAAPVPVPRPSEIGSPNLAKVARAAGRVATRRTRAAMAAAPQAASSSFVERLFGLPATPGPVLAYAALPGNVPDALPAERPDAGPAAGIAVYDIGARTVTLPSGERLEAHSGLGPTLDDPRYVHLRMRGATPPGTYDLTLRESLFHGVRALRLNPVGGSAAVHGRAGLLAHTFMLGPNGDSNGCVSFRQYDRFLQAYLRGEIRQLVVVAGRQDGLPGLVGRLFGSRERPAPGSRGT